MTHASLPKPGDQLRDDAAELLSARYGPVRTEFREGGKKADVFFTENNFGKSVRVYVEAKDYHQTLKRSDVVKIWADYSGIIDSNRPSTLLLVTRAGLTADAQAFVEKEQAAMRHQSLREIENDALGLASYNELLQQEFEKDGLDSYYIDAVCARADYDERKRRNISETDVDIFKMLKDWINDESEAPIAILGGYGAGKSSLARRIISYQANEASIDASARRPILLRLGDLTRYSNIEGLLGGMFTSEFPTPSFNFRVFDNLNNRGRLLIVLDGFDEMKHAMTWSDFRSQIKDLIRLSCGKSKVILLGRPSAFISFEEHVHVLKGLKKSGSSWRREIEWPDFVEYDLSDFSEKDRDKFVKLYLSFRLKNLTKGNIADEMIESRIAEVKRIVESDEELFGKPVHLKILVDLASDLTVDLMQLGSRFSRWQLYEIFFSDLLERESEKAARRGIDPKVRLSFLKEVAFWLWTDRGGLLAFRSDEIPRSILNSHVGSEGEDGDVLLREFLVGAFLEKKGADTFYFGHRSFAEFLVACRMLEVEPRGGECATYSRLCSDGVAAFLQDHNDNEAFGGLIRSLPGARGEVHGQYLKFLAEKSGGKVKLLQLVPKDSTIYTGIEAILFDEFEDDPDDNGEDDIEYRIFKTMKKYSDNKRFFSLFHFCLYSMADNKIKSMKFCAKIAAVILERLFVDSEVDTVSRKTSVPGEFEGARRLAGATVGGLENRADGVYIRFSWEALLDEYGRYLRDDPVRFALGNRPVELDFKPLIALPWHGVLGNISPAIRRDVEAHFKMNGGLDGLYVRVVASRLRIPTRPTERRP